MKYSYFINSYSTIEGLRILLKKLNKINELQLFDNIYSLIFDSKLLYSYFTSKKDSIFSQIKKIMKQFSIIPSSTLLYEQFNESLTENDEKKLDYLNNFYAPNEDVDEISFKFQEKSFKKYLEFYNAINDYDRNKRQLKPTLERFFNIQYDNDIKIHRTVMPYVFLEDKISIENIITFESYIKFCLQERNNFDAIVIYTSLDYLKNIINTNELSDLSKFNEIFIWLPSFNERDAKINEIQDLKKCLQKIHTVNSNIVYLFGGMQIGTWFQDYVKEIIVRIDLFPGYKINPLDNAFSKRVRRIFYPQFGRPETPTVILSAEQKNFFKCDCISCRNFLIDGDFDTHEAIQSLIDSNRKQLSHNIHSFLKKLSNNEDPEIDPNKSLNNLKLTNKWRNALNG